MEKFSTILKRAIKRKGSKAAIEAVMPVVKTRRQLLAITDDRVLAEFTRCIFQAGFSWKVVEKKWDGFEKIFFGFEPKKMVLLTEKQWDKICQSPEIIRNRQKIMSVPTNAQFILDQSSKHGSFAKMIADWPKDDLYNLYALLKKQGSRLGGMTGPRALRYLGVDTYLLTKDVVSCLQQSGIPINDSPTSQRDLKLVQSAFDTWHSETGMPFSHLSRICSYSIGDNIMAVH